MGVMSDLDILSDEVRDNVQSGMGVEDAVDAVARHSTYDADDIEWAYSAKHGEAEASDSILSSEYDEKHG